ncbi:MAG TPA: O-antigen ligase family protein [Nitrospirales bacterium]
MATAGEGGGVRDESIRTLPGAGAAAIGPALESAIRGVLFVYILALPFRRLLFVERNGFILLLVLLGFWCAANRTHFFRRTPIDLPLLAFVGWVGLSIPFATFPDYSVQEFGKLLQQILVFYAVLHFFHAEQYKARLLWSLILVSLLISAYGIVQFFAMAGVLPALTKLTMIESFTGGEVWLTTYLVMTIPISLAFMLFEERPMERRIYGGATALGVFCLLLTFSRAGLLALLAEVGVMISFVRQKLILGAITVFCLAILGLQVLVIRYNVQAELGTPLGVRGVEKFSLLHRFDIWQFTTRKILLHPLVGIGYGKDNFRLAYGTSGQQTTPHFAPDAPAYAVLPAGSHNIFLDLALGSGIPAAMAFLWLLWRIVSTARQIYCRSDSAFAKAVALGVGAGVIGMAVRLSFDQMLIGTLAIQFWVWIALCLSMYDPRGPEPYSCR